MSALLLGLLEFVTFFLATLNFRACAKGWWRATLATDLLLSLNGFYLTKRVVEASAPIEVACYLVGAGAGSALGMWLTRHWTDSQQPPQ